MKEWRRNNLKDRHLFHGLIRLYNWLSKRNERHLSVHPVVIMKKVSAILESL